MRSPAVGILQRVFGYPSFRGRQAEIVEHIVAGGDALVLMPTGGGKSLCYRFRRCCGRVSASSSRR